MVLEREGETETSPCLTKVVDGVAGLVQCSRVELESDDSKDENGEHDEEADLHEWSQSLQDRLEHHLEAFIGMRERREEKIMFSVLRKIVEGDTDRLKQSDTKVFLRIDAVFRDVFPSLPVPLGGTLTWHS